MSPTITKRHAISFLARVRKGKPEQCWPYEGGDQVVVGGRRVRPQWLAASVAKGRPLWPHEVVRARCETEHCSNPAHLAVLDRGDARYVEPRAVPSSLPSTPAEATCSYCGHKGGKGTAVVCGRSLACPVCSAPEWPDLVARYGADAA